MSGRSKKRKITRKRGYVEMLQINNDPDDPVTRQKSMSLLRRIKIRLTHDIRRLVSVSLLLLDIVISRFFWIQISLYRIVAKKEPLYLMGKEFAGNETIRRLEESFASLQRKCDCLQIDNQNEQSTIEHLQYNLREAERENDDLKIKLASFSREKDNALRRLREGILVKLKDNNPNIVDLNDVCRPSKLAEMFRELYDNEWTSAFVLLELQFTEEQAVTILLDTVMEAYYYCEKTLEEPWRILSKWFLNPELEEFLLSICKIPEVEEILLQKPVQNYTRKCIELCLLMVTTDPPVVLGCPGWIPSKPLTKEEKVKMKAKANQPTVEEMRNGTDADKMKQRYDENVAAPDTSNAKQCTENKDSAANPDRDSTDGTKHTAEVEEEKGEEENDEGNSSSSYDTLKDLEETTTNQKQSTEVQETLSPEGNKINSSLVKTETLSTTTTDQLNTHSQSDLQPVGETQSEGEGAKQESKNQKGQDEETLRIDEEAKEEGKEEQQDIYGKEAVIKEERKKHATKNNGKTEEEEMLVERQQFDKNMFEEYTTRGKYLEFVVWPAMYLHKGGPLLGKGIAQGTKEPKRKAKQPLWSWRNVNA